MKKTRLYIFLMCLMLAIWNISVFKPIKVVAMFIHEIGHNLMAFFCDRKLLVFNMTLDEIRQFNEGTSGWISSFIVANGGYIMSLVFAVLMLRINKKESKRCVLGILASSILLSLAYKASSVMFLHVVIFVVIILVLYMLNNDKIFGYAVDIIGISSIAYCIHETLMKDILPDVFNRLGILKGVITYNKATIDSQMLFELTGIPVVVWGIFWFLISLVVMIFCMNVKKKRKY